MYLSNQKKIEFIHAIVYNTANRGDLKYKFSFNFRCVKNSSLPLELLFNLMEAAAMECPVIMSKKDYLPAKCHEKTRYGVGRRNKHD